MDFLWEGHFGKVDMGKHPVPGNLLQSHLRKRSTPQERVPFPGKSFPIFSCSSADVSCQSTPVTDPTSPSLTSLGREIPVWSRTRAAKQQLSHKMEIGMARGDHAPSQGCHKTRQKWELFPKLHRRNRAKAGTKQGFKGGTLKFTGFWCLQLL